MVAAVAHPGPRPEQRECKGACEVAQGAFGTVARIGDSRDRCNEDRGPGRRENF